jgi:hypothetical protein
MVCLSKRLYHSMPRKAKAPEPTEQLQPALFSPGQLPDSPVLIEAAKQFIHSGKITCKNEEFASLIVSTYLASGSLRRTAKRLSVSPNTVKGVLAEFEKVGKLDALKQRLSEKLGLGVELATDLLNEKLEEGSVPANVLPIVIGVLTEKKELLDGNATQRVESTRAEPLDASGLLEYLKRKQIAAPAIDVQSTVSRTEPKELEGNS